MKRHDRRTRSVYNLTAPLQDWLFSLTAWLDGVNAKDERRKLIDQLDLSPGQHVLEVGSGTGRNLPLLARPIGENGRILAVDISEAMLQQARRHLKKESLAANLIVANASRLPLASHQVDAVLHFGGFNQFDDKEKAIREMMRVARSGGIIAISDKCFLPNRHRSWRQKLLSKLSPSLETAPPLALIPLPPQQIEVKWFWNDMAYIVRFVNPP